MSEFWRLNILLQFSNIDFKEKIMSFEVPSKISWCEVKNEQEFTINEIFNIWDLKDSKELPDMVYNIMLKKRLIKVPLKYMPLIDFTRLIFELIEIGERVKKHFDSIKVKPKDPRISEIAKKYSGDNMDFIARFCNMFPTYTIQEALNLSWVDIFLAFKSDAKDALINREILELK